MALLYIDLDNFKQVNDNYGHEVGDKLLMKFGEHLQQVTRPTDMTLTVQPSDQLARLAGDEFVTILPEINEPVDAAAVAQRHVGDGQTLRLS